MMRTEGGVLAASALMRVGEIQGINALPLFAGFHVEAVSHELERVRGCPMELNHKLREGELDVALISVTEYLAHRTRYTLLPGFCVGAWQQVQSVKLFFRGTLQELHGVPLALTPQSSTSVALLKILCQQLWRVTPHFVPLEAMPKEYPAFLLIGDDCLRYSSPVGYQTIDLASAWGEWTGMPFTFAVFAVRNPFYEERAEATLSFLESINKSLEWSEQHPDALIALAQRRCPLPEERLRDYFSHLRYRFDQAQEQALMKFTSLFLKMARE